MKKVLILVLVPIHLMFGSSSESKLSRLNLNPFKLLFSSARAKYIQALIENNKNGCQPPAKGKECPFCFTLNQSCLDTKSYILKELKYSAILLNIYPYNNGHLLVIPKRHRATLNDLNPEERFEIMEVINLCTSILGGILKPDGFNIGINLSRGAGATVPEHLHIHVVPRWNGDTNFLLILDGTKPVSVDLDTLYKCLKPLFDKAKLITT